MIPWESGFILDEFVSYRREICHTVFSMIEKPCPEENTGDVQGSRRNYGERGGMGPVLM
jgi:hypothetical protein